METRLNFFINCWVMETRLNFIILNFIRLVSKELDDQALNQNITNESFKKLALRVQHTIANFDKDLIDRIIDSMNDRMEEIIKVKGGRTK